MPDLLTHALFAHAAARRWRFVPAALVFIFGALLPDLVTRPWYIVFPEMYWAAQPLHTPLGLAVLSAGLAGLFRAGERGRVFGLLMAGVAMHLAMDALQRHADHGYFLLFPSWQTYHWGLWWPQQTIEALPVWLGLIAALEAGLWVRRRARRGGQTRVDNRG